MTTKNKMRVVFPAKSINESFSRMVIAAFAAGVDPTVDELCDIKTAVSEAVTNSIVHGYADKSGDIIISCTLDSANVLKVKIQDKGCGIANVEEAMQPLFTTSTSGERAGLGFAVMMELMDKIRVRSSIGKGTTVTLIKKLSTKQ